MYIKKRRPMDGVIFGGEVTTVHDDDNHNVIVYSNNNNDTIKTRYNDNATNAVFSTYIPPVVNPSLYNIHTERASALAARGVD